MKSINYLLPLIFALAMIFPSCKKNDKTAKEILTSKSWKMSSEKINNVLVPMDDCVKDDFVTFSAAGTYVVNIGAATCYDGQTGFDGTWTLSADEKTLTLDGDPASVVITESQLVVTLTDGPDTIEEIFVPK